MSVPAAITCSACGKSITSARLRGLCAACLVRGVTATDHSGPAAAGALFSIPGHDVLEEIARGGMGIVYRARQHDPAREVALKMLLPGGATPALRERFRNEARTMADLDHPGVLPLYQFGEHGGTPWFTMKLAGGGSLAERLKDQTDRSDLTDPRAAAALMADIAEAVAYAHQRGVLHRDLKPGNILFDAEGRAYVADFGLAKLTSASAGLTHSRAMLGTPHYLAPELAAKAGTTATVATDVYALGAILYELLAGRPPFHAETMAGLLRSIIEDDPPSLLTMKTTSAGLVPRGLAAIAGKAMAKEPARRYRDAAALAADLRAWLAGEAIEARPPGAREKFLRWVRRHPALAASLTLLAAGLSTIIFLQAKSARELRAERDVAEAAKAEALAAQVTAARTGGRIDARDEALLAAREAAALHVTDALRDDAITLLASPGIRGLDTLPQPESAPVDEDASPDGARRAAVEGGEGGALVLTVSEASGAPQHRVALPARGSAAPAVRWRADGGAVAVVSGWTEFYIVSLDGPEPLPERAGEHSAAVFDVAWHPSGEWLATAAGDGTVRIWESAARRELVRLPLHAARVEFSADGRTLSAQERFGQGTVRFEFSPPEAVRQCLLPRRAAAAENAGPLMPPWGGALTDDGALAVATGQFGLEWMDTATGRLLPRGPVGAFWRLALHGDKLLVLGKRDAGQAALWRFDFQRAAGGRLEFTPPVMLARNVETFAASGDCSTIVLQSGKDPPVLAQTGDPRRTMRALAPSEITLGFSALSPDARWRVLSAAPDSPHAGLAVWDLAAPDTPPRLLPDFPQGSFVVFSPDSATAYVHSDHGLTALITGPWTPRWQQPRRHRSFSMNLIALSGDGSLLAVAEAPSGVALHDPVTGRRLALLRHPDLRPYGALALDHDASSLLATGLPSSMQVWHLRTLRRQLRELGLDWR